MDEVLVEFCRRGTLGPLILGSSPAEVIRQIGEPGRIKSGHGDDCFQSYRYSGLVLGMRCFNLQAAVRRGAVKDLVLTSIRIEFRGGEDLTLPEAVTGTPIASAGALQLDDAHRVLTEHGVDMVRDHEQVLTRSLDGARVRVVCDDRGFVQEMYAGWRPSPGGWFYSEENETGVWVSADEG